jgi:hypothetical protein
MSFVVKQCRVKTVFRRANVLVLCFLSIMLFFLLECPSAIHVSVPPDGMNWKAGNGIDRANSRDPLTRHGGAAPRVVFNLRLPAT